MTLLNRVKVSTATTGTGTITLGAAETGFQTFAAAGATDGQTVSYVIEDGDDWEYGRGTYTASGTALSRDIILGSSNAGSAINLSGSAVVYCDALADDLVTKTGTETLTNKTLTDPAINVGSDATGDLYYRASDGSFERLPAGTDDEVLTLESGLPRWAAGGGGSGGSLLQTVQDVKSDTASTSGFSWGDTGLSVSITLNDAANKVLLTAHVSAASDGNDSTPKFRFVRGSTAIGLGDAAGSQPTQISFSGHTADATDSPSIASGQFIDDPGSVGPHTYKIEWYSGSTSYINRSSNDVNFRSISALTAQEIT